MDKNMETMKESLIKNIKQDDATVSFWKKIEKWVKDNCDFGYRSAELGTDYEIGKNGEIEILTHSLTINTEDMEIPNYIKFVGDDIYTVRVIANNITEIPKDLFPKNVRKFTIISKKLKTLEGCPLVCDSFDCSRCGSLKNLKGMPEVVMESIQCAQCESLESLEGAPKTEIKSTFDCSFCANLKTLKGAPKKVKYFSCAHCTSLTSLEGAPKIVTASMDCNNCTSLTSLKGCPEIVMSKLELEKTRITLADGPKKMKRGARIIISMA